MKTLLQVLKKPNPIKGRIVRIALLLLAGLAVLPAVAQFNGTQNYIYISGQLTNNVNGAPIADHDIYITSDTITNNGFQHYSIVKTDIMGFYRDTVITTLEDGALNIYLYDFNNYLQEATQYYRFTWSDNYQMIANFAIFDPNATSNLQANFRAEKDTITGNNMSVIFRDMTFGYKIKSWSWDFGDGTYSSVQDPDHIYEEPGIYLVTLTVSAYPPEYEYYQTSTIVKQVEVGLQEYFHLGGHVFTGMYPPIDVGLAYLYMINEESVYIPIDTAVIDTLGYYYFYQLIEGNYTTKARLDEGSAFYGQYIPTYLGNVLAWDNSVRLELTANNWECDIHLIESAGIPSGKGQIVGQMLYDTSLTNNPLVPAGDIEVVLMGVEGSHITCKVSDLGGSFTFPNLAFGTYQLYPDVAGVPTSPVYVTISEDKPVAEDFSLVISEEQVTYLGIGGPDTPIGSVTSLYPNPCRDVMRVDIEMQQNASVRIMIIDPSGRVAEQQEKSLSKGNHELTVDVSNLANGFYQVMIISEGETGFAGKFIKLN
jgi:hypothetical protein